MSTVSSASSWCVPEKSAADVGSVRSEKSEPVGAEHVVGRELAEGRGLHLGQVGEGALDVELVLAEHDQDGAVSLSLRRMVAASLVLGASIFQSSTTTICPMSARSLSAESRARRTILPGVRCA